MSIVLSKLGLIGLHELLEKDEMNNLNGKSIVTLTFRFRQKNERNRSVY